MENKIIYESLSSFFRLFHAHIEKCEIHDNRIIGTVGWENEEDKQDFTLLTENTSNFSVLLSLCNYLHEHNYVKNDCIYITEAELIDRLSLAGWKKRKAKKAINYLCSFEVKMLDNGEETDSFFIHF